ncbi:MAG: alpha/beta hydrolase [Candidatus Kapabacteria bacterium]|jgi:proline iminopeptidase|nr:alpha/beta hydrolase [Candidatus Kapabacteria bacterium]
MVRLLILFLCATVAVSAAPGLHVQTFGTPGHPAILFLHGGPGYNAASFEIGAAQQLADRGFYVITFDQRGSGRSAGVKGTFSFAEAIADIDSILRAKSVDKAVLVGHSFGGVLAVRAARDLPGRIRGIVLVGAPMDFPETFRTIHRRCEEIYGQRADSTNLGAIRAVATLDSTSILYATGSFSHAMKAGLYTEPVPTDEARSIMQTFRASAESTKMLSFMTMPPVIGFINKERYTTLAYLDTLSFLARTLPIIGLYGEHDGLFDSASVTRLASALGRGNLRVVPQASHSVFLDRRTLFLDVVEAFIRKVETLE